MRLFERLLCGLGVYTGAPRFQEDGLPTFDECRDMIRERAYQLWAIDGYRQGDGTKYWYAAEKELFNGLENGGYRIFVCDESKPKQDGFYRYWDIVLIKPTGPEPVVITSKRVQTVGNN